MKRTVKTQLSDVDSHLFKLPDLYANRFTVKHS